MLLTRMHENLVSFISIVAKVWMAQVELLIVDSWIGKHDLVCSITIGLTNLFAKQCEALLL